MESVRVIIEDDRVTLHADKISSAFTAAVIKEFPMKPDDRENVMSLARDVDGLQSFLRSQGIPYAVFLDNTDHLVRTWYPDPQQNIETVSGISSTTADHLRSEGLIARDDLRRVSQQRLTEVAGIGNGLATRIKADVDGYSG